MWHGLVDTTSTHNEGKHIPFWSMVLHLIFRISMCMLVDCITISFNHMPARFKTCTCCLKLLLPTIISRYCFCRAPRYFKIVVGSDTHKRLFSRRNIFAMLTGTWIVHLIVLGVRDFNPYFIYSNKIPVSLHIYLHLTASKNAIKCQATTNIGKNKKKLEVANSLLLFYFEIWIVLERFLKSLIVRPITCITSFKTEISLVQCHSTFMMHHYDKHVIQNVSP
jgi:hypothetical protein